MLPFRSGRAGFSGASSVFLFFIVVSCAAFAAEKAAKPEATVKSKSKERPKPEEGVTNIPIATGHDARGLVLPDFDHQGRLRGKLEAGVTRRLDDERVEFSGVKFVTFAPETEKPDLEILMSTSVFNLKTQVLNSSERTTVKRSDFEIVGDTMQFEMLSRKGTLDGNVKMVVRGKARARRECRRMTKLGVARAILCSALLVGIARGQGSAPSTLSSRLRVSLLTKPRRSKLPPKNRPRKTILPGNRTRPRTQRQPRSRSSPKSMPTRPSSIRQNRLAFSPDTSSSPTRALVSRETS